MTTVLTIGDVEPDRPTVAINRVAPAGRWQRWKYDHLDVLLRWSPVRFTRQSDLYPLRLPSEFGMRGLARLRARQTELAALTGREDDEASMRRADRLLREITAMVLEAPDDVIAGLTVQQRLQVLAVFPVAVTGRMPAAQTEEAPSTSADSSPASAGSIPAAVGRTG